jgi:ribosome biogenesis GTPase
MITGVVVSIHKTGCEVLVEGMDKPVFSLIKTGELPVVNDNVQLEKREDKCFVKGILPRKNLIARYDFYKERHQGFAANIDTVFVVTSANREFSLNRVKRFLALCEGQNVRKVVVVTKVDLTNDAPKIDIACVEQVNINSLNPKDVGKLKWKGTALMMGSSGVGKSTILNTLCGLNLKTREVQGDRLANKGRHTTSARTMYFLKDGRRIIDTPGVRIVGIEGESAENRRGRARKS